MEGSSHDLILHLSITAGGSCAGDFGGVLGRTKIVSHLSVKFLGGLLGRSSVLGLATAALLAGTGTGTGSLRTGNRSSLRVLPTSLAGSGRLGCVGNALAQGKRLGDSVSGDENLELYLMSAGIPSARFRLVDMAYIEQSPVNLDVLEPGKGLVGCIRLDKCDLDDSLGNTGWRGAVLALDPLDVADEAILVESEEVFLNGRKKRSAKRSERGAA